MDLRVLDLIKSLRRETMPIEGHSDPGAIQDTWDELIDIVTASNRKELLDAFMKEEPTELKADEASDD